MSTIPVSYMSTILDMKGSEKSTSLRGFLAAAVVLCCAFSAVQSEEAMLHGAEQRKTASSPNPPNVLVFLVDDLGWNQVGYHAAPAGNNEIQTPNIDAAVAAGIELNRGYVTPWCVHCVLLRTVIASEF
jgi:hypothetical protein